MRRREVERRGIDRRIGSLRLHRIREVVAAAVGDRRQAPVALDELEDRDMVAVLVGDVSPGAQRQVLRVCYDD